MRQILTSTIPIITEQETNSPETPKTIFAKVHGQLRTK